VVLVVVLAWPGWLYGQIGNINNRAVGGVSIDPSGVLSRTGVDGMGQLRDFRLKALQNIPAELNHGAGLRKVSLRGLEAAITQFLDNHQPLPDAVKYLAGLQQIQFVLVFPEQHDIVLVGPGEGWKIDAQGNLVGVTSGRPVLLLDDLLVALRTAQQAAKGGISCSIDPTPEGLARLKAYQQKLRAGSDPQWAANTIEQALGPQTVSIAGVPGTTHFARMLVAADYRMKRLAMNFEPAPIANLPSFLQLVPATKRCTMFPRWWLAPNYQPVLRSADGLAWELRGASVKAMTEEEFVSASGNRERTNHVNPLAQKWADNMTVHYDELAIAEPIFGQLRNCMDLALVSALIAKEKLAEKAGNSLPLLMDSARVETDQFAAPRQVDTRVSMLRKGNNWVMSASGGVQIDSWGALKQYQPGDGAATLHAKATPATDHWWWN
jgi:hypothetical protein